MAGTDTPDAGAPRPSAPVRPPRRVLPPDPATAPDDGGWTGLGQSRHPAERHRRLERMLWLLVAAVTVAGLAVIGAILTSSPSTETILPSDAPAADVPLAQPTGPIAPASPGSEGGPDDGHGRFGGSLSNDAADHTTDLPGATDGGNGTAGTDDGPGGDTSDDRASDGTPLSSTDGGVPAGWSEVARGFGLAFTRTGVGRDAWFATMSSWLTPEQAAEYRDVPIESIPTGALLEIDVADPGSAAHAHGTLTYDTGMVLEVGLSYRTGAGGWLVARVELADAA